MRINLRATLQEYDQLIAEWCYDSDIKGSFIITKEGEDEDEDGDEQRILIKDFGHNLEILKSEVLHEVILDKEDGLMFLLKWGDLDDLWVSDDGTEETQ